VVGIQVYSAERKAYSDCGLLCCLYLICSEYFCVRLRPVCPTYEEWHEEQDRLSLSLLVSCVFLCKAVKNCISGMEHYVDFCMHEYVTVAIFTYYIVLYIHCMLF
jgi:hypothetical protein